MDFVGHAFEVQETLLPSQDFLNAPPGVPDYRSVMEQWWERTAAFLTGHVEPELLIFVFIFYVIMEEMVGMLHSRFPASGLQL